MCDYFLELMMWSSLMYLSRSMAEVSLASSWVLSLDPLMKRFCALTITTRVTIYTMKFVIATCHGVILPGHVTEALHQSSLQLPGTRTGDATERQCYVM